MNRGVANPNQFMQVYLMRHQVVAEEHQNVIDDFKIIVDAAHCIECERR